MHRQSPVANSELSEIGGWKTLAEKASDQPIDLEA
jgi:hypothetical protein